MTDLEPMSPQVAVEWYLDDRREELSHASQRNIEQGLTTFLDWADEYDLNNMNDFTGRKARRFKTWRQNHDSINQVTLNSNLAILRRFIVFCESIEAVEEGTQHKVPTSIVSDDDDVRKDAPPDALVSEVREFVSTYRPCSREHVEIELIAEVGLRSGTLRAIDVDDFYPGEKAIKIRHRPEQTGEKGTPLKNGNDSNRSINISTDLRDLIQAYLENPNRPEGTDKFGRRPLFTRTDANGIFGRIATGRIRDDYYKLTRPCELGIECPADRNPDDCDATKSRYAYKCPENTTPHPLRSWSIMAQLDHGVSKETLTNRVDVSVPVLEKHYDEREDERQRKVRLSKIAENLPGYEAPDESDDSANPKPVITNPVIGLLVVGTELGRFARRLVCGLWTMSQERSKPSFHDA